MAAKRGRPRTVPDLRHTVVQGVVCIPPGADVDTRLTEKKGTTFNMSLQTIIELKLDPVKVGQLLFGFISELKNPCPDDNDSLQRQYPYSLRKHPGECFTSCGCGTWMESGEWKRFENERGVGHAMGRAKLLGNALVHMEISAQEWAEFYDVAISAASTCAVPGKILPSSAESKGWISPLAKPSQVTAAFGTPRGDHPHNGVDLSAAVGTQVVAPVRMQITDISRDDRAGIYVKANAARPDGTFPKDVGNFVDTGWILTFAHLQSVNQGSVAAERKLGLTGREILPTVGSIVEQGQPFALSGATGEVSGPHLHFAVEWLEDNPVWDQRVFVDPTVLVPREALVVPGTRAPVANLVGTVAIVRRRGAPESQDGVRNVIINNNGVIGFGRDNVTAGGVGTIDPDLSIGSLFGGEQGANPTAPLSSVLPMLFRGEGPSSPWRVVDPGTKKPCGCMGAARGDGPGGCGCSKRKGEGPRFETTRTPSEAISNPGGYGSAPIRFPGPPTGAVEFFPLTQQAAEQLLNLSGQTVQGAGAFAGRAFTLLTDPRGIATLTNAFSVGASAVGGAFQVGLQLTPFLAASLALIAPLVGGKFGPALGALASILGSVPAAPVSGTLASLGLGAAAIV